MKKIAAIFLVIILSFAFLVSCGSSPAPSNEEAADIFENSTNVLVDYFVGEPYWVAENDIEDLEIYEDETVEFGEWMVYYKTNYTYEQAVDKYSEYFAGQLLDDFMSVYFYNDDGTLCVKAYGGASGFQVDDAVVTLVSQDGDIYNYEVTFSFLYYGTDDNGNDFVDIVQGEGTFSLQKTSDGYSLSDTDVCYPVDYQAE